MDDLTNSFNYFVTSGDYCSHTNLASNIHPRLLDYKKKSSSSKDPDPDEGEENDEEIDDGNEPDNVGEDITAQAELLDKNKSEIVDDIDHGDTDLPKFAPRGIPDIPWTSYESWVCMEG